MGADSSVSEVDQIRINASDFNGRQVVDVYGRQSGRYAVYQTDQRVVIIFADDPLVQRIQRKRLAKLSALRNELDGTLSAWRCKDPKWSRLNQTARQFDMRIASALIEALEGNAEEGVAILRQVKADVAGEMASRARLSYVIWTLASAGVFLLPSMLAYLAIRNGVSENTEWVQGALAILRTIAAGVLGAVYSIALGIQRRDLKNDLRSYDYFTDSFARVGIGALAAFVFGCLLLSGAIQIGFAGQIELPAGSPASAGDIHIPIWPVGLIAGFLAGFAERLVPELLESYAIAPAKTVSPHPSEGSSSSQPVNQTKAETGNDADVEALPESEEEVIASPSTEEKLDGCDVDLADRSAATPDEMLPAASGGVAQQ